MNRFLIEQLAPPLRLKDSQAKQNSLLGVSGQLKAGEDIACRTLELSGIWKLQEASDFPIFFQLGMGNCD